MGERYFTYDHCFSPDVSQERLYQQTAGPMLKSFLEGYNVTILAYGQTGASICILISHLKGSGATDAARSVSHVHPP